MKDLQVATIATGPTAFLEIIACGKPWRRPPDYFLSAVKNGRSYDSPLHRRSSLGSPRRVRDHSDPSRGRDRYYLIASSGVLFSRERWPDFPFFYRPAGNPCVEKRRGTVGSGAAVKWRVPHRHSLHPESEVRYGS